MLFKQPALVLPSRSSEVVFARGMPPIAALRAMLARAGGLAALALPGQIVAIKPTLAWNQPPEMAANTSPEVLRAVVELSLEAGAAEVRVFDRASFRPDVCYRVAGATAALAGFDPQRVKLLPLAEGDFVPVAPDGGATPRWRVCRHVLEADRLINLPVAKQHPARQVSLGLPNLLGAAGGAAGHPEWDNNAFIGEVTALLQPDLTILDATRVLTRNGPLGRSLDDVRRLDTLALGADPVSVDIYGASLFELEWHEVFYLRAAMSKGLGPVDPGRVPMVEVS